MRYFTKIVMSQYFIIHKIIRYFNKEEKRKCNRLINKPKNPLTKNDINQYFIIKSIKTTKIILNLSLIYQ